MREPEAHCTFRKMAAFYQCVRPDPSELDMISTRVMDVKLREAAEGLGEDGTGKKKSKFKTFKKLFGKKKRKESPSSTGPSTWKQSQAKSEVIAVESGPVGYDSEDELEESRGTLGSRALSHDSIFIPEAGQDPARPVRVFSQENVCDRIKALQLKIQCNVRMGPPPPGGIPAKRAEDTGMSSEDDGLPRSPPEMSLLHDVGPSTTIKISLVPSSRPQSPDHTSDATVSSRTSDNSLAPVADFSCPPEFSSCLDNSAAKHKLLVKPRNRKMRRLSSRAQSESLSDLICTPEEEGYNEKLFSQVSMEENISSRQQELMLDREPEPRVPVILFPPGGPRARRARLQHCPALSASMEEGTSPGDEPSSRPATPEATPGATQDATLEVTPEVTEPVAGPSPGLEAPSEGPGLEAPSESEGAPHPSPHIEIQAEEPSTTSPGPPAEDTAEEVASASGDGEAPLSICVADGPGAPPETVIVTLETPPDTEGAAHGVQEEEEVELTPRPEGAGDDVPTAPAPSPPVPKSCLKHKAAAVDQGPSGPPPPAAEPPPEQPSAPAQDPEAAPAEHPRAKQAEPPHAGPERAAPPPGRKSEPRATKKFSVSSCRARSRPAGARLPERPGPRPAGVRAPPLRSSPAWRSEAALDDLPLLLPEPQPGDADPPKPAECDSQEPGEAAARRAGPGRSPQDAGPTPGSGEPSAAAREDRNPFPVKLRSTSLSLKYREGSSSQEAKGIKRYSAEVRLERGGLTLLPKDEQGHSGSAPLLRGARSPNSQGKGKARSPEQPSSKPPLPRKPLLQSLTLPYPPAGLDASLEPEKGTPQPDPRKETRMAEKSPHKGAEKGLPPAITGPAAEGQPNPPWITMARQKRRGAPEQLPHQEDKPGVRITKPETGKQVKPPEKAQEPTKQADFVRSKSFLMTPAKPVVTQRQGAKLSLKEGLQRGISLSHQNLAQAAAMTEKELHQLKRASYASADQPSWMELARKKSQAWSDMPQIIK
ncbi:CRACD-like protein isoform 2-T2 [Thomomys bottae]